MLPEDSRVELNYYSVQKNKNMYVIIIKIYFVDIYIAY
jgi:hypothetical protein